MSFFNLVFYSAQPSNPFAYQTCSSYIGLVTSSVNDVQSSWTKLILTQMWEVMACSQDFLKFFVVTIQ